MKVLLNRRWRKDGYTIGEWIVDGVKSCNTLEDEDRGLTQQMTVAEIKVKKVAKMTAIPTGLYRVAMTYSPRFKRNVPEVQKVKGFSGVRVHAGNTTADTEGCILLGDNTVKGMVTNSRKRCEEFERALMAAGGVCELEIR